MDMAAKRGPGGASSSSSGRTCGVGHGDDDERRRGTAHVIVVLVEVLATVAIGSTAGPGVPAGARSTDQGVPMAALRGVA